MAVLLFTVADTTKGDKFSFVDASLGLLARYATFLAQSALPLCPSIGNLYHTQPSNLYLRDQFVVKYSAASGGQASLGSHYDESCFYTN